MDQLGSYLKTQRELRNIDITAISDETKIGEIWLSAIENDRWEDLPGKTFARGYARAYAKALGLNIDEVLSRYDQMYVADNKVEVGDNIVRLTKKRGGGVRPFIPYIALTALIATALLIWLI